MKWLSYLGGLLIAQREDEKARFRKFQIKQSLNKRDSTYVCPKNQRISCHNQKTPKNVNKTLQNAIEMRICSKG